MALHFTIQEFKNRKGNVLREMHNAEIDALLMFKQESMYWLTGYDTFGYVFFQCLVLDKSGNIILLTRAPDLRQAQNTSNIKDIRIWIDKDGANPIGLAPSLSIQILISLILDVFCACLKSGALVSKIIFPDLSNTRH